MILLLDIGNSRIKWAWLESKNPGQQKSLGHREFVAGDAYDEWRGAATPVRVLAANVAGPLLAENLRTVTENLWNMQPEFVESSERAGGVTNGYAQHDRLGVDRWLCLLGARALRPGPLCIADCGTAITVDFLDGQGQHHGGVITPGLNLMHEALLQGTREVIAGLDTSAETVTLFARDTQQAIQGGSTHAAAALLDHSLELAAQRFGGEVTGLLTGGDAGRIAPLLAGQFTVVQDLVLQGLAVIANEKERA